MLGRPSAARGDVPTPSTSMGWSHLSRPSCSATSLSGPDSGFDDDEPMDSAVGRWAVMVGDDGRQAAADERSGKGRPLVRVWTEPALRQTTQEGRERGS